MPFVCFTDEQKEQAVELTLSNCSAVRAKPSNAQVLNMRGKTDRRRSLSGIICGFISMSESVAMPLTLSVDSITSPIRKRWNICSTTVAVGL